jgi:hypothetical protein
MTLDTYESAVESGRFLTVLAGTNPDLLPLPGDKAYRHLQLVARAYAVNVPAAPVHVRRILGHLTLQGFALHGPEFHPAARP